MPAQILALPTVIGAAENALRALLIRVLSGTPIAGYDDWVTLNVVDRVGPTGHDAAAALGNALAIDEARARELLESTVVRGLVSRTGNGVVPSPAGATALADARPRVRAVTQRVLDGLPPAEIDVAVRVLDRVRAQAERELGHGLGPGLGFDELRRPSPSGERS